MCKTKKDLFKLRAYMYFLKVNLICRSSLILQILEWSFRGILTQCSTHSVSYSIPSLHFPREITGKPKGTIARRELPILPSELVYRCQEKAWFDEQVMMDWVQDILAPYVANVPRGIVPIILLDDFTVHKSGRVVDAIQQLGIEVEFIPPGCTGMVQPMDVG